MNQKAVTGVMLTLLQISMLGWAFDTSFDSKIVWASSKPTICADPPAVIDSGLTPGTSFTADIKIADANIEEYTDVGAYQIRMTWNNTILDIDNIVTFGDFLDVPRIGWWGELTMDAPAGQKVVNVTDGSKYLPGYDVLIQDDNNSEWNEVASFLTTY